MRLTKQGRYLAKLHSVNGKAETPHLYKVGIELLTSGGKTVKAFVVNSVGS